MKIEKIGEKFKTFLTRAPIVINALACSTGVISVLSEVLLLPGAVAGFLFPMACKNCAGSVVPELKIKLFTN